MTEPDFAVWRATYFGLKHPNFFVHLLLLSANVMRMA
jgi:hypothetical protein